MSTIRVAPRERYTNIPKSTAEDDRLTWGARGLLLWLLGKPDDWHIERDALVKQSPDGPTIVRRLLKELSDNGYLVRTRVRLPNGRFMTETVLHQHPQPMLTAGGKPTSGPTSTFVAKEQVAPLARLPLVGEPPAVDAPVRDLITEELTTETEKPLAPALTGDALGEGVVLHARPRDPLFEAVAEVWTGQRWPIVLTDRARAHVNAAVADLREAGATADEVYRRGGNYRRLYDKRPTPTALAKHWPSVAEAPPPPMRGSNRSLENGQRWKAGRAARA